ncbi:MAG: metallophosphoesterase family protein [Verrucomicrobia bacterium]|nr:metallophosphoesterase family protein [Verrucomicrobiota bacterium]
MRIALFGDIHANLEALNCVLDDAEKHKCTHYVCLGDVVGYNANPHECVKIVQSLECPVVKGNHDEQAAINDSLEGFNPLAEEALNWTRNHLTAEDRKWLNDLKMVRQVRDFTIVHATLDTPHRWGYVFNQLDAAASFTYQTTGVCFFGHTHAPRAYIKDGAIVSVALDKITFEMGKKYFINIGSVGQPRDGDWRAAYTIYDIESNSIQLRRLEYDIQTAQRKILEAGLPRRLADRLAIGK